MAAQGFTPAEFGVLVALAIQAGQERAPAVTKAAPAPEGPYVKAARALRAHFHGDPERFESAMSRFAALMHLFARGRLQRWSRTSAANPNAQDLHPAVVHVAAQMKLNASGKFPERKFLAAVAEVADQIYGTPAPPGGERA